MKKCTECGRWFNPEFQGKEDDDRCIECIEGRDIDSHLIWVAFCLDCQKILQSCPNGTFAEAAARIHKRENQDHHVICGFNSKV